MQWPVGDETAFFKGSLLDILAGASFGGHGIGEGAPFVRFLPLTLIQFEPSVRYSAKGTSPICPWTLRELVPSVEQV